MEHGSGGPLGPSQPGSSESLDAGAVAADERKLATVVFADLVGSTQLGGSQDPERTRAMLDRFYDAMAAEIERAGGTVEKFVGDAVMAAFGAPRAHEDHAERALHASLSMQRRLVELFDHSLALRIGVNTGEVVLGRAREGSSFVTGDAVNVAARLEQAAAPGEILAGERTVAAVRGAFEFAEPAIVEAKGKPEGLACRRLLRALSLMRPRGVSGLRRAFVARATELARMENAYRSVSQRASPHLVTISGEAGVGKTRLVREFWEQLGSEIPEPLRRTGRCLPYGRGITYWPLGEILKEEFGILESDPPETVLEHLGERAILGLTLGLDVARDVHPLAARDRLQTGWVRFVQEMVAHRPAVVLIEDIHWAEPPLFDLLDRLVEEVRGPLLVLATARPELYDMRPGWGGARLDASAIELEALPSAAAVLMLDELLAGELPEHVTEMVVRQAEGNPFFLEELVESLIDQGALRRSNGEWSLSEQQAGISVPDSVQAVLASRIDLLPPAEKAALQAASVIGRVFWTLPVYELVPGLKPDFRVLEARDFVRRRAGSSIAGETEYAFKHQLTREVAYEGLPTGKRARLHAAFATWLEGFGGGRDEHAPLLAHHFAAAVRPEDADLAWAGDEVDMAKLRTAAIRWLRRAAELAVGRYDLDDGIELLERALELAPADIHVDLWKRIAEANALKYDGQGFWEAMEHALGLTTDRIRRGELLSVLAYETAVRLGMWRTRPDPQMVGRWVDEALELVEKGTPAQVQALLGLSAWRSTGGLEPALDALALAERLGRIDLISSASTQVVAALLSSDRYEEAFAQARSLLARLGEIENPDEREGVFWSATLADLATGRIENAREDVRLLTETARELTPHHRIHAVGMALMVHELTGHWEEIRARSTEAERAVSENTATPCTMNARSLLVCALAAARTGDESDAQRLEASADALEMEGYGLTIEGPRLRLALVRSDLESAERLLESGEAMYFARTAATAARLDALVALGRRERVEEAAVPLLRPNTYLEPFALRALGRVREDEDFIARALEGFEKMGLDWHVEETRALISRDHPTRA